MKLITLLYELMDVLGTFSGIDRVLLIPSPTNCTIRCVIESQGSKSTKYDVCIVDANTNEAVVDLVSTVGIWPLKGIRAALKSPGMSRSTASAHIEPNARLPKLILNGANATNFEIGLFNEDIAKARIPAPNLPSAPKYEITAAPAFNAVEQLQKVIAVMRSCEDDVWVTPFTNISNDLIFRIQAENDWSEFVFATDVKGAIAPHWRFRGKEISQLMKHYSTSKSFTVRLFAKGLMTIELQTTLAIYLFHVLAVKS